MSAFEGTSFGEYEGELKEMLEKAQGAGAADIIAECQDLISQMKLEMRTMPKDEKAAAATAIQVGAFNLPAQYAHIHARTHTRVFTSHGLGLLGAAGI